MEVTPERIRWGLIAFFSLALALFIIAPLLCDPGAVNGLDGTPVVPDYFDLWGTLNPLSGTVYAIGDILCHQSAEWSFELNGSQMPICVRDISALAGLVAGLLISVRFGEHTSRPKFCIPFLIVSFALMIADVVIQNVYGLNVFSARIVTGLMCGAAVAFAVDRWIRASAHEIGVPSDKVYK